MNCRMLALLLCATAFVACGGSDECADEKPSCTETCAGEAVVASCNSGKWECKVDPVLCVPCEGEAPACISSCTDGSRRWVAACKGGAWACEQGVMVEPGCNPDACEPVHTGDRCTDGVLTCAPTNGEITQCPSVICSTCDGVLEPLTDSLMKCECQCRESTNEEICFPVDIG